MTAGLLSVALDLFLATHITCLDRLVSKFASHGMTNAYSCDPSPLRIAWSSKLVSISKQLFIREHTSLQGATQGRAIGAKAPEYLRWWIHDGWGAVVVDAVGLIERQRIHCEGGKLCGGNSEAKKNSLPLWLMTGALVKLLTNRWCLKAEEQLCKFRWGHGSEWRAGWQSKNSWKSSRSQDGTHSV